MDIEDIAPIKKHQHIDEDVIGLVQDLVRELGHPELNPTTDDFDNLLKVLMRKYRVHAPKSQMRTVYEKSLSHIPINAALSRYFIKRVVRSESGVLVVTIVTKPGDHIKFSCPEKCAYCPTETNLKGVPTQPKSYLSTEPAMARANRNKFDIGDQIRDRIKSYIYTGNINQTQQKKKMEVILSGGTWDVMPKTYRDQVINEIYYTFNTYGQREAELRPMLSIREEKTINQTSTFGVIGLTIETRPDYVTRKTLLEYLDYGVTRVQLGGQSTHDDILVKIKRGCTKKNMKQAIRLLKGIGMKVVTHWMPDLPGSSPVRDAEMFETLISDPDLQSDDWKVYPCAVIKSSSDDLVITSDIHNWYADGSYVPYSETNIDDLINMCIGFKTKMNPWIRIERLIRDIPTHSITAGYGKMVNLRQVIHDRMDKMGVCCKCIRCMEIKDRSQMIDQGKIVVRPYLASGGQEYHISFELERQFWNWTYIGFCIMWCWNRMFGKTIYYGGNMSQYCGLFGFLRLRIDAEPGLGLVDELLGCGLIREVHVYGISTSVGNVLDKSSQHKGIGQQLMCVAEDIIRSHGVSKSAVIAGIGARDYYKNKCGYELGKYYMIKNL
jgi:ELP3 family radical SAM enzyme/protein acetyltransferase